MESEIESLKSEIERLSQRISNLEIGKDTGTDDGGAGGGDAGGANEAQVIPQQKLRAFDVICDGRETDPWLVYLPDGCCKYGDFTPNAIQPEPDSTTHLADLQDDTKNGGIYAHLYLELDDDSDSDSSTEPEVVGFPLLSIDTTPTQAPSEENIKVINVKIATITDGAVAQNVSSALIFVSNGDSRIRVTGTDGVSVSGTSIVFKSADDSNVEIKASVDTFGRITLQTGVYYK